MPLAPPELRWHDEVDVGIVGAGGCGLVAAHAAAQQDADARLKIVIWEKAAAAGGSTALSTGMIPAAGSRIQLEAGIVDTPADLARDVQSRNHGGDGALSVPLCEGAASLVDWLAERGVRLELVANVADPGHTRLRLHAPPARTGQQLIHPLVQTLERRGIRLRLSTPVLHLWTDADGGVVGVRLKVPRKSPVNVRCQRLILACDGFGANRDLLAQHCPEAAALTYVGAPANTGDALSWAADVGAATRDLGAYEAYASVAVGSNLLIPWEVVTAGAILVNQQGERFADESRGSAALVAPLLAQSGRVAYEVLDGRILQVVSDHNPSFATTVVPRVVRRADDAEALARQFQITPGALARTVTAYNATAAHGSDAYGRTTVSAPLAPPFYGIRVGAALVQTLGGLAIDASARVLRADGVPVPRLYAGGGAAAGISGPGNDGYLLGSGLLCALGWGKIAGAHAAHAVLAARTTASAPHEAGSVDP